MFYGLVIFSSKSTINHELNEYQKNTVAYYLGLEGYRMLKNNGCDKPLAEYLNTGKWSDSWCASHYSHIKRNLIDAR